MTKSSRDWEPVHYCADTDTMAIELRPWPGQPGEAGEGEDAGPDLVIHYYPGDGKPWLWEIEHASQHPEYIAAALIKVDGWQTAIREMRGGQQKAHTEGKDDIVDLSARPWRDQARAPHITARLRTNERLGQPGADAGGGPQRNGRPRRLLRQHGQIPRMEGLASVHHLNMTTTRLEKTQADLNQPCTAGYSVETPSTLRGVASG